DHRASLVVAETAEVAAALRGRRHRVPVVGPALLVGDLEAREKERPVLAQRPAERAAVLVALQALVLGRRRERITRVERVVAQELEPDAAKSVRAGSDRRVDDRPGRLAVLRGEIVRLNAELRQRVDRGL